MADDDDFESFLERQRLDTPNKSKMSSRPKGFRPHQAYSEQPPTQPKKRGRPKGSLNSPPQRAYSEQPPTQPKKRGRPKGSVNVSLLPDIKMELKPKSSEHEQIISDLRDEIKVHEEALKDCHENLARVTDLLNSDRPVGPNFQRRGELFLEKDLTLPGDNVSSGMDNPSRPMQSDQQILSYMKGGRSKSKFKKKSKKNLLKKKKSKKK